MGLVGAITNAPTHVYVIDQLTYFYSPTSNRLVKVQDNAGDDGFKEPSRASYNDEYEYDINGNLVADKNKNITKIEYNFLDLPTRIIFQNDNNGTNPNSGVIEYTYNAMGTKLKKTVKQTNQNTGTSTFYAGNMVYEQFEGQTDLSLQFIGNSEGYAEPDGQGSYNYIYQYKDHLGNVRVSYKKDKANSVIISEDYETSTYDWATNGEPLSFANQKLNFSSVARYKSINKYVNFTPNKTVHIEFDFEKGTMIKPMFFVKEKINGVWEDDADRDAYILEDGHFEVDLNLSGDRFRIYFSKASATDNGDLTTCYIDNLIITQNIIEIVQAKNYYPFGMDHQYGTSSAMSITNGHKFKYNGQEHDESFGLNVTEMTFRQFDMALGRFHGIDKLAGIQHSITPYHFGNNNPIAFSDPSGLIPQYQDPDQGGSPNSMNVAHWGDPYGNRANRSHWSDPFNNGLFSGGPGHGGGSGSTIRVVKSMIAMANTSNVGSLMFTNNGSAFYSSLGLVRFNGSSHTYNSQELGTVELDEVLILGSRNGSDWGTFVADKSSLNDAIKDIISDINISSLFAPRSESSKSIDQNFNIGIGVTAGVFNIFEYFALKDKKTSLAKGTKTGQVRVKKFINPSLKKLNGVTKKLGYAGVIYNGGTLIWDIGAGEEITATRLFDTGLGIVLSAIAITNPVVLVGLAVYTVADAYGAFDGIKESLGGNTVIINGN